MEGGEGGADPISKLRKNKRPSLGPEWSMSEVGTPPPHNSNKPHRLVASNNNNNNNTNTFSVTPFILGFGEFFQKINDASRVP